MTLFPHYFYWPKQSPTGSSLILSAKRLLFETQSTMVCDINQLWRKEEMKDSLKEWPIELKQQLVSKPWKGQNPGKTRKGSSKSWRTGLWALASGMNQLQLFSVLMSLSFKPYILVRALTPSTDTIWMPCPVLTLGQGLRCGVGEASAGGRGLWLAGHQDCFPERKNEG